MPSLSEDERRAILGLARQAVVEAVCHNRQLDGIPDAGVFQTKSGVFVTLHVAKRLHGCIGVIEANDPLGQSVAHCAMGAALEDPRFPRMQAADLASLEIEVSLLSTLEAINPEAIEIGRHGILIEQGLYRGLLLPQVAVEHHLDRERFLKEACYKAGLHVDAWKDPHTLIFGFTCEIFADPSFHDQK
jgi:AmmeMemoRadiSam system protein A